MAYIFVSYSRRDKQELEKLVSTLQSAGHGVWWDVRSIQGGEDWQAAIKRAIVDSDVTVSDLVASFGDFRMGAKRARNLMGQP